MAELGLATVVFDEDLPLFDVQLASIEQHLTPEGFGEFLIIENPGRGHRGLSGIVHAMVRNRLGVQWRQRVRITKGPATIPHPDGYRRQQVLKLWAATVTTDAALVVLDAKNSFVGQCGAADIIRDGRPRLAIFYESNSWLAALNSANRCWGMPDYQEGDSYAGPYTPFVLLRDEVSAMIRRLAEQLGGPGAPEEIAWEGFCFDPRLLPTTEFLLYSQYLVASHGALTSRYEPSSTMSATIFSHWPNDEDALAALRAAGPDGVRIIGLHRRRLPTLTAGVLTELERLWTPIGIEPQRALRFSGRRKLRAMCSQLVGHQH